jgi:hypothetical protein
MPSPECQIRANSDGLFQTVTLAHFSLPAIAILEQLFLGIHLALLGHALAFYTNRRRRVTLGQCQVIWEGKNEVRRDGV